MEQTNRIIHCLRSGYYIVTSDFTMRESSDEMLFVYVHAVKHQEKDCALFVPLFYADHPTLDAADRTWRDLGFHEVLLEADLWNKQPIDERRRLIEEHDSARRELLNFRGIDLAKLDELQRAQVAALKRKLLPSRLRIDPSSYSVVPVEYPSLRHRTSTR